MQKSYTGDFSIVLALLSHRYYYHTYILTSFCCSLSYFLSDQLKLIHLKRTMLTFTPATATTCVL